MSVQAKTVLTATEYQMRILRVMVRSMRRGFIPPTLVEVANELSCTKAAVYHHAVQMVKEGLLEKKDRRERCYVPTKNGRALVKREESWAKGQEDAA